MPRANCPRPALTERKHKRSVRLVPLLRGPLAEKRCSRHTHREVAVTKINTDSTNVNQINNEELTIAYKGDILDKNDNLHADDGLTIKTESRKLVFMSEIGEIKKTKKFNTLSLVYVAMCAAIMAVCSWISIPLTVPVTLQTFAVFFALYFLGGDRGTISVLIYILLGAVGVPVFSGFKGGLGTLLGTTGGYIIGFVFSALIFLLFEKIFGRKLWAEIVSMVLGLLVCYAFGTAWFMVVYARNSGAISLGTALTWCVFPFILPDIAKIALAIGIGKTLRKAVKA